MSPAIVAVNVRMGCNILYHGSGTRAAFPEAIQTTIVSPTARITPKITAVKIPLIDAGITVFIIVSARVAPKAYDPSRNSRPAALQCIFRNTHNRRQRHNP